jgi:hypothetical protein
MATMKEANSLYLQALFNKRNDDELANDLFLKALFNTKNGQYANSDVPYIHPHSCDPFLNSGDRIPFKNDETTNFHSEFCGQRIPTLNNIKCHFKIKAGCNIQNLHEKITVLAGLQMYQPDDTNFQLEVKRTCCVYKGKQFLYVLIFNEPFFKNYSFLINLFYRCGLRIYHIPSVRIRQYDQIATCLRYGTCTRSILLVI